MLVVEMVVPPQGRTWGFGELTRKGGSDGRTHGGGGEHYPNRSGGAPLAVIVFVVATAIHPSREDVMDNQAVFMEYAQSQSWIAVHLAQWVAALLLFGGLVAVYYSITRRSEAGAAVARFGLAMAVLTAAFLRCYKP